MNNNFDELVERVAQRISALLHEARPGDVIHLTPAEMSAHMGVKEKTLANLRSRGQGPRFVKIGGAVRYPVIANSIKRPDSDFQGAKDD